MSELDPCADAVMGGGNSARTVTSLDLLTLPRTDFAALLNGLPALRRSIEEVAARRAARGGRRPSQGAMSRRRASRGHTPAAAGAIQGVHRRGPHPRR
jgi:hypothetical protein